MHRSVVIVGVEARVRTINYGLVFSSMDDPMGGRWAYFYDVARLVIRHMNHLGIALADANKVTIVLHNHMLVAG